MFHNDVLHSTINVIVLSLTHKIKRHFNAISLEYVGFLKIIY